MNPGSNGTSPLADRARRIGRGLVEVDAPVKLPGRGPELLAAVIAVIALGMLLALARVPAFFGGR